MAAAPKPGQAFHGKVVFHPGAAGLRGVIRMQEQAEPRPFAGAAGVAVALDGVADALARVPWLEEWPVMLSGVRFARFDSGFAVVGSGGVLPVLEGLTVLPFVSVAGGAAVNVFGVWNGRALQLLALGQGGRLYQPSVANPHLLRRTA